MLRSPSRVQEKLKKGTPTITGGARSPQVLPRAAAQRDLAVAGCGPDFHKLPVASLNQVLTHAARAAATRAKGSGQSKPVAGRSARGCRLALRPAAARAAKQRLAGAAL